MIIPAIATKMEDLHRQYGVLLDKKCFDKITAVPKVMIIKMDFRKTITTVGQILDEVYPKFMNVISE